MLQNVVKDGFGWLHFDPEEDDFSYDSEGMGQGQDQERYFYDYDSSMFTVGCPIPISPQLLAVDVHSYGDGDGDGGPSSTLQRIEGNSEIETRDHNDAHDLATRSRHSGSNDDSSKKTTSNTANSNTANPGLGASSASGKKDRKPEYHHVLFGIDT
jgi:hypothetical protein